MVRREQRRKLTDAFCNAATALVQGDGHAALQIVDALAQALDGLGGSAEGFVSPKMPQGLGSIRDDLPHATPQHDAQLLDAIGGGSPMLHRALRGFGRRMRPAGRRRDRPAWYPVLMADPGDDRNRTVGDGAGEGLVVEAPQIFHRSTAAHEGG